MWGLGPEGKGGAWSWLGCWLLGAEDLLCGWDQLVWDLTCRALRTCGRESLRALQLMQKLWCFSRAVYQVGPAAPLYLVLQHEHYGEWWGEGRNDCHMLRIMECVIINVGGLVNID